jgi:hypothetical protein
MKECRKRDEKATQRRVSIEVFSSLTQMFPSYAVFVGNMSVQVYMIE